MHQKEAPPKIIYCTRTHTQIKQIIKELNATHYFPRMSVLASRKQYCINPEVKDLPNRDHVWLVLFFYFNL